jgi:two-component system sensor histidine kinase MprB
LRLVDNLLDNACKFDQSGAPVEVTVSPGRIEVRDHGPGVAPADAGHVFDRFYRSAAARSMPGSGLGLAIASEVAVAHGGALTVVNHPDGGAVFSLELPPTTSVRRRDSHPGLTALPSAPYIDQPELPA